MKGSFGFITTIYLSFLINFIRSDYIPECVDIICPDIEHQSVECPPDSRSVVVDPVYLQSSNMNNNHERNDHYPSPDQFYVDRNDDDREKRSIQFTRRESIKIIPVGYKNKRSAPIDEDLMRYCCAHKECVCKEICQIPSCPNGLIAVAVHKSHNLFELNPGSCCPKYNCQKAPNCSELPDNFEWQQICQTCHCISNETICKITCDDQFKAACKSESYSSQLYLHGQKWMEDACTSCICNNGTKNCDISVCRPLSCINKIQLPGDCCPICDFSNSQFCDGYENCDIACRYDFVKTESGCNICKCQTKPSTSTTTVSTTTITTITTNQNISTEGTTTKNPTLESTNIYIFLYIIVGAGILAVTFLLMKYLCRKNGKRIDSNSNELRDGSLKKLNV